jgi:hypothetical protein
MSLHTLRTRPRVSRTRATLPAGLKEWTDRPQAGGNRVDVQRAKLAAIEPFRRAAGQAGESSLFDVQRAKLAAIEPFRRAARAWTSNNIGDEGARALATVVGNSSALTALTVNHNNIGSEDARALAAALDTNRTLQLFDLWHDGVTADIKNVVVDRLRVNKLALKVPAWSSLRVAGAPFYLGLPPSLAESAVVLAFGDELVDVRLENEDELYVWLTLGGRAFAAAYLQPLAHAALLPELQRLASAVTAPGQ